MKKVFLLIISIVIARNAFSQKDSWNSQFILSINPANSDQEQKDILNRLLVKARVEGVEEALPLYYNALAAYYYQVEKPESMIKYLYKAIEINHKKKNTTLLSTNYNLLSIYYQEQQDYIKALESIERAIEYLDTVKQTMLLKIYQGNLASIYFMMGDYENAKRIYERNIDFYLSVEDTFNYASELYNLAFSYYKLDDFQNARKTLSKFMNTYNSYSDKEELLEILAQTYGILEKIHFDEGNYNHSLHFQTKKFEIAKQLNFHSMIAETSERLSNTYEKLNQWKEALQYSRLAALYKDSVLNETRIKALTEMESRYENKIKTLELADAQNKIAIAQRRKKLYLTLNLLILTILIGASLVVYQKIKLNQKELLLTNERIGKIIKEHELDTLNAQLKGQEMEREHIAMELHDRVASLLGSIIYQVQKTAKNFDIDGQVKNQLMTISSSVKEAANEIRRISHNLSTGMIHRYGLKAALSEFGAKISQTTSVQMSVEFTPINFPRLNRELETHLYRIIQEFTTNTLKHAKATEIHLYISLIDGEVNVLFEDNGRGLDPHKKNKGIGIQNIQNRLKTLNGSMDIEAQSGRGTAIYLKIPTQKISVS